MVKLPGLKDSVVVLASSPWRKLDGKWRIISVCLTLMDLISILMAEINICLIEQKTLTFSMGSMRGLMVLPTQLTNKPA